MRTALNRKIQRRKFNDMESQQLKNIIEAALLAAGNPLSIDQLKALFGDDNDRIFCRLAELLLLPFMRVGVEATV